ncbi:MAG: GIY-YIG nuclease family protein [Candidatus Komeilibacteria bacterium]
MYYVYILFSKNKNKKYLGSTSNLKERLKYHNDGLVKSTKAYRPWKIIYYEAHSNKTLARKAELFYKTGQGRRQIRKKLGLD